MTTLIPNPQIDLAFNYVRYTNKNIFLTGKAGTGKTTFLQKIKADDFKQMIVVAPTGVAAINAGGMTIHSLFQLPFGPMIPGNLQEQLKQRKYNRQKIQLFKSIDLLIIDEISMVRADLLDAIDAVLRRFRDRRKAFGGVQLLMVGDLHQLPPVVKKEDRKLLSSHYQTLYFFGSQALQATDPVRIELKHIYRQSDDRFIQLLNKVRNNRMDKAVLDLLNSRYKPDFQPEDHEGYITLTSHNATASEINQRKLKKLKGKSYFYKADIEGNFPEKAYPTEERLEFKIGAQVMFIKNDSTSEKLYYNGKIGRISTIDEDGIWVKCNDEQSDILVNPVEWENRKYSIDKKTKEVKEEVLGIFRQIPLKTAWAITIHKSQGLTFERAIIDAKAAFAHGQVYVALSRCKSFEGLVLRTTIEQSSVRTDQVVRHYSENGERNSPNAAHLQSSKRQYQAQLISELFETSSIIGSIQQLERYFIENEKSVQGDGQTQLQTIVEQLQAKTFQPAQKFSQHLAYYYSQDELPEANGVLQDRLRKAAVYFIKELQKDLFPKVKSIEFDSDNQGIKKGLEEKLADLQRSLFIKLRCFESIKDGFDCKNYLRSRTKATLDFKFTKRRVPKRISALKEHLHPMLQDRLIRWRSAQAKKRDVGLYIILPNKLLVDIVRTLPSNPTTLKQLKGMGPKRIKQYSIDIIGLVNAYCREQSIGPEERNKI
jgi:hypothetical protein